MLNALSIFCLLHQHYVQRQQGVIHIEPLYVPATPDHPLVCTMQLSATLHQASKTCKSSRTNSKEPALSTLQALSILDLFHQHCLQG